MQKQVHVIRKSYLLIAFSGLGAVDTPLVYTTQANAILVVGPCLWVLLKGWAYENRLRCTHSPFQVVMHTTTSFKTAFSANLKQNYLK